MLGECVSVCLSVCRSVCLPVRTRVSSRGLQVSSLSLSLYDPPCVGVGPCVGVRQKKKEKESAPLEPPHSLCALNLKPETLTNEHVLVSPRLAEAILLAFLGLFCLCTRSLLTLISRMLSHLLSGGNEVNPHRSS